MVAAPERGHEKPARCVQLDGKLKFSDCAFGHLVHNPNHGKGFCGRIHGVSCTRMRRVMNVLIVLGGVIIGGCNHEAESVPPVSG